MSDGSADLNDLVNEMRADRQLGVEMVRRLPELVTADETTKVPFDLGASGHVAMDPVQVSQCSK